MASCVLSTGWHDFDCVIPEDAKRLSGIQNKYKQIGYRISPAVGGLVRYDIRLFFPYSNIIRAWCLAPIAYPSF